MKPKQLPPKKNIQRRVIVQRQRFASPEEEYLARLDNQVLTEGYPYGNEKIQ